MPQARILFSLVPPIRTGNSKMTILNRPPDIAQNFLASIFEAQLTLWWSDCMKNRRKMPRAASSLLLEQATARLQSSIVLETCL